MEPRRIGILLLMCLAASCGRVAFDPSPTSDASVPASCATVAARIPSDAQVSFCEDFEEQPVGPVADRTKFVGPRLYVRANPSFMALTIVQEDALAPHALRYGGATSSTCSTNCCYGDVFIDYGELVFTSHAHLEYDIALETLNGSWVGSMFWGSLNFPYTERFVSPALGTGAWHHVEIDGEVGNAHPLTIMIDGEVRPNMAGTNNLGSGIQGSIGTFCSDVAGSGAFDNIMFWGR